MKKRDEDEDEDEDGEDANFFFFSFPLDPGPHHTEMVVNKWKVDSDWNLIRRGL